MGKSSKDTICELLMQTPEYKSAIKYMVEKLQNPTIARVRHIVGYDSNPYATIEFDVGHGHLDSHYTASEMNFTSAWVSRSSAMPDAVLMSIIKANFGVPKRPGSKKMRVPTYNLKMASVIENFQVKVGEHLGHDYWKETSDCSKKITAMAKDYFSSPENEAAKQLCLDDRIVQRVKETLKPFKNVSDDVLRRAFDEYIASVIMDG